MKSVAIALAASALTLLIVGGFLALDEAVLHIYSSEEPQRSSASVETGRPSPAYSRAEAMGITEIQAAKNWAFPSGSNWMVCNDAVFKEKERHVGGDM